MVMATTLCKGDPEVVIIVEGGDGSGRLLSRSTLCCSSAFRNCRLNQTGIHFDVFYPLSNDTEYISSVLEKTIRTWNAVVPNAFDTHHSPMLTRSDQIISYNHRNQIGFGPITMNPDALAVTALWLVCKNETQSLESCTQEIVIVECDQIYGSYGSNLAYLMLHEFGHVFGLGDLLQNACSSSLMFYSITDNVPAIDRDTKSCLRRHGYNLTSTSSVGHSVFWRLV